MKPKIKRNQYNETDPSNIFCKKCEYWMARVHAKKVGDEWVCLDCLKKRRKNAG